MSQDESAVWMAGGSGVLTGPTAARRFLMGAPNALSVETLISTTRALYPASNYDEDSMRLRRAYHGDQESMAKSALRKRYPKTWQRIPIVTQNIVRETAELDAQTYRQPPMRTIETEDGVVDDDSTKMLNALLTHVGFDDVMVEAERIAAMPGVAFLRPIFDDGGRLLDILPEWPHNIFCIYDEERPSSLIDALVVAVRIAGKGTDLPLCDEVFEVWVRDDDAAWRVYHVDKNGKVLSEEREASRLGVYAISLRKSASLFPPLDRDLLILQDNINTTLSDHHYRFSLQAHSQLIATGTQPPRNGTDVVLGPDTIAYFPDSGSAVTQTTVNDSIMAFEAVSQSLALHARGKRQPIEAWHTKGGNPESGESRKIKNQWSDQKRAEHVRRFSIFERSFLAELCDALGIDIPDGHSIVIRYAAAPVYESETAKLDRALKMQGAGWISPARAAVLAGAYQTIEDAQKAGVSSTIERESAGNAAVMAASRQAESSGEPVSPDEQGT